MANENLGPAERIIQTLLAYSDHMVHNRPGMVTPDGSTIGVKWEMVTHKVEDGKRVVYKLVKGGKPIKIGHLWEDNTIRDENRRKLAEYRPAGLFPEVVAWMYRQVAEVWKMDNEFAARWASYAFKQEHRDLKVVLAAFMLVQSRKGEDIKNADGKVEFQDADFRDVGEAMMLLYDKSSKTDFNPKLLLRVGEVLKLPAVAAINRELGFGRTARKPFLGRWPKAVEKWLSYREANPRLLEGLVKAGMKSTVMDLARMVGYKPQDAKFFEVLGWRQHQAPDGRRTVAIGKVLEKAESWEDLTEEQICGRIVQDKPNWKAIIGRLPKRVGVTRAVVAAAIEAGSFSNKDLIIATPTLEELGLLQVQDIRERWEKAIREAEDMRAANIARNVKTKEVKDKLDEAADNAVKKAMEEATKGLRIYFMVDKSGSMEGALDAAKRLMAKFVQGFPEDKLHACTFNTYGTEIKLPARTAAGVENAFRGVHAGGGTDYGSGIRCLEGYKGSPEEDNIFFFVGDEGHQRDHFAGEVEASGLKPVAFALLPISAQRYGRGTAVRNTASRLGIPCVEVDEKIFEDPYAVTRTLRNLISATPVAPLATRQAAAPARVTLAEQILKTDLLTKPAWAA